MSDFLFSEVDDDLSEYASIKSTQSETEDGNMSEATQFQLLMAMLLGQVACGTQYYNIVAFFPLFVSDNYADHIDQTMVSLCLSAFQVAAVIFPKVHAITIHMMGRKNAILFGFFCIFISTMGLGLLALIPY